MQESNWILWLVPCLRVGSGGGGHAGKQAILAIQDSYTFLLPNTLTWAHRLTRMTWLSPDVTLHRLYLEAGVERKN